jgi:glycine hydroxymethyltransferase
MDPSGIRLGTASLASRGMAPEHMDQVATWIDRIITHLGDESVETAVRGEVAEFTRAFPAPGISL